MTDHHRSPEDIEHEINHERGRIKQTLGALEDRMSIGAAVDRATEFFRGDGRAAADGVGHVVRSNPAALALIGAGVAWLAMSSSSDRETDGPRVPRMERERLQGMRDRAEITAEEYRERMRHAAEDRKERVRHAGRRASLRARGMADEAGLRARGFADEASLRARGMADEAGRRAARMRRQASHAGRQVEDGAVEFFDRNPLAAGALAFAAGAAIGAFAPNSRYEDRMMGDYAERFREDASDAARDAADRGRRAAEAGARTAADRARSHREVAREEAVDTARAAAEAAEAEARRPS